MFSLSKLAYNWCNGEERTAYDELETLEISVRPCCLLLILYLRAENADYDDNPLICDCDLRWYRDWLKELRHRDDDDIIQKKHILCLMEEEHREFSVLNLPVERMNCVGKKYSSSANGIGEARVLSRILIVFVFALHQFK